MKKKQLNFTRCFIFGSLVFFCEICWYKLSKKFFGEEKDSFAKFNFFGPKIFQSKWYSNSSSFTHKLLKKKFSYSWYIILKVFCDRFKIFKAILPVWRVFELFSMKNLAQKFFFLKTPEFFLNWKNFINSWKDKRKLF